MLLALCAAAIARAQSVTAQVDSAQAFVNEPLRVVVRVSDLESFDGPSFTPVADLDIKRLPGEQTSTSITFINGQRTQLRNVSMSFEVIPARTGSFVIPAFTVESDGQRYSSIPIRITVGVSNAAELMVVRVASSPRDIFVGQQGSLNLELLIKRYSDAALGVTLDEQSTWSLVDVQNSSWGAFGPALQKLAAENRRPRGEIRVVDGTEFLVYTISKPFDPIAAGAPSAGDIRIRMEYPTRLQRDRSFFLSSGFALAGSRTLSVSPSAIDARVLPLPEGSRPKGWNGAVGEFELFVVAKPVEVAVGDPITLTMRLTDSSGTAGLDGLQAPSLAAQPAFVEGFRVPGEAASGTVEGRSKIFTQSIRALSESVREIPSVEFSFFNPAKGEYETIRSQPIAIKVKPSAIARVNAPADAPPAEAGAPKLTAVAGGLVANMSADDARASGTVSPGVFAFGVGMTLAAGLVPLAMSALLRRVDPRVTRRAVAMSRLERALGESLQPDTVEAALLEFVAARLGVSSAGFSRKDACDTLARAGVDAATIERTDQFLRECERARYLGGALAREQAIEVARAIEAGTQSVRFAAERSAA